MIPLRTLSDGNSQVASMAVVFSATRLNDVGGPVGAEKINVTNSCSHALETINQKKVIPVSMVVALTSLE